MQNFIKDPMFEKPNLVTENSTERHLNLSKWFNILKKLRND